MTTVKVGSQDAEGFHPNGDIVDPNGILDLVAGPLATKANAASLALKLDKTEAATTYATQTAVAANTTNIAANTTAIGAKADNSALALKLDKTEAAATYVKFVDQNGSPLIGRHVTIKVNSSTGEILDIISET